MSVLIDHLERHLGAIQSGWPSRTIGSSKPSFQVAQFSSGSGPGTVGYATLGLHRQALRSPASNKHIHMELLALLPTYLEAHQAAAILLQVGETVGTSGLALLRGHVIGPAGRIWDESEMTAFYVGIPVYFPDAFAGVVVDGVDVVLAWLIPIYSAEAEYIWGAGWESFEQLLAELDPDLTDLQRPSVVV